MKDKYYSLIKNEVYDGLLEKIQKTNINLASKGVTSCGAYAPDEGGVCAPPYICPC